MKISVVIGARNEYPIILSTIYSFYEELIRFGYEPEFVVVDNMSTDDTPDILADRFRRWVKSGMLKVVRYNQKPANVLVRNIGAAKASGEILVIADAHLSIQPGTIDLMIKGCLNRGGLWHPAINIWGDTSDVKCYGYKLALDQKFWGNLSRHLPKQAWAVKPEKKPRPELLKPYKVPMASHCCIVVRRDEYLDFGGYNEEFRCYGGGEPYLDLKWWLFGSKVWLEPRGLVRHAFGLQAQWRRVQTDKTFGTMVYTSSGDMRKELKKGEEHLHYSRGYSWNNEMLHFNFMLSAYTIGGYGWLQKLYRRYWDIRKINDRYIRDLRKLRREVLVHGEADRNFIASRQIMSLDDLLGKEPWDA